MEQECSLYLRQHAGNPVDWRPFSQEAFDIAANEDKPLIVSIGYSSCHWCHVMEKESFEDKEVASLMNENFISVKVDREERPDVDAFYMECVHSLGRRGGWPLNCFVLPDKRMFFGGTYFSKPHWISLLQEIVTIFHTDRQILIEQAELLLQKKPPKTSSKPTFSKESINNGILKDISAKILMYTDSEKGGLKGSPKFPMPPLLLCAAGLYYKGRNEFHSFLEKTMDAILNKGLHDHLNGGFFRYAVDTDWSVPHFEKMLYDNAQLISCLCRIAPIFPGNGYQKVIPFTIQFVENWMKAPAGGMGSSLDADSEGEEGVYYTFSEEEIVKGVPDEIKYLTKYLSYLKLGDESPNQIVLQNPVTILNPSDQERDEILTTFSQIFMQLRNLQSLRPKPVFDSKVIVSWNALYVKALSEAYNLTGEESYLRNSESLAEVILQKGFSTDGELLHYFYQGKDGYPGFLEDYANLADALLTLYSSTGKEMYIQKAEKLIQEVNNRFFRNEEGMYFYIPESNKELPVQRAEVYDNVMPSSNAVLCHVFIRLGKISGNLAYFNRSNEMLTGMMDQIQQVPVSYSAWIQSALSIAPPWYTLSVHKEDLKVFYKNYPKFCQHEILVVPKSGAEIRRGQLALCSHNQCFAPVHTIEEVMKIIEDTKQ